MAWCWKDVRNLFQETKDWLLPPNYLNNGNKDTTDVDSPKPPIKEELKTGEQSIISPKREKWGWGPNCHFCKNQEEDWDGNHQKQLQQNTPPQQETGEAPSKVPPDFELPKTPTHTEAQPRDTT